MGKVSVRIDFDADKIEQLRDLSGIQNNSDILRNAVAIATRYYQEAKVCSCGGHET
jgi:hypothetical protein